MKQLFIILFAILTIAANSYAQSDKNTPETEQAVIKTTDGNTMIGTVEREDENHVWLKTESYGIIQIKKSDIISRKLMKQDQIKDGEFWFENPNATRNLYGPTGYGLRKGEGYYQNFYVALNSVSYGFTDYFTLGVGLVPFVIEDFGFYTITPKFSFPIIKEKLNAGAGLLYARIGDVNAGIGYGVLTYGGRDNNITIGAGYGYADEEWTQRPIITLSGMTRLSKRISLVTENWLIATTNYGYYQSGTDQWGNPIYESQVIGYSYEPFFTYSIRYMMDRLSLDIGFINSPDIASSAFILGVPLVGVVIPFEGKKK